jgi:surfactin synthase thioesterase subunit
MKKINLLCLPYAGGSSVVYKKWGRYFDESINIIPVELAGRGKRLSENFYKDMESAIDDIYKISAPFIEEGEYALYGHSMGSTIAFELCQRIISENKRQPVHLFVSGRYPPDVSKKSKCLSKLPDKEFMDEILRLGGTSKEVFDNKELCSLFVPIIKADYRIIEEYKYINRNQKFNCGITVFNGRSDEDVTYEDALEWGKHTSVGCGVYEFDGDHFFINNKAKEITDIIKKTLTNC